MRLHLLARHVAQGAHVVRAVGQLDQDDAHVARHGQQHLAERLGLVFLAGVELQLVQLGQAIHQFGHRRAEALDQLGLGDAAVFHGVVQQRGHQGLRVELPFGALGRDGDRVGDVGLAAVAQLAQVGLVGKAVGLPDLFDVTRMTGSRVGRSSAAKLAAAALAAAARACFRRTRTCGCVPIVGGHDRAHALNCSAQRAAERAWQTKKHRKAVLSGRERRLQFSRAPSSAFRGRSCLRRFRAARSRRVCSCSRSWACGPGSACGRGRSRPERAGSGWGSAAGSLQR